MTIKQLSVFVENREGRLEQVTGILEQNGINIAAFSLADTTEYGMIRLVVSKPEEAKAALKTEGISAMLTEVLAVRIPNEMGSLHKILLTLKEINIEYMYVLSTREDPSMVIKVSDPDRAAEILTQSEFALMGNEAYGVTG